MSFRPYPNVDRARRQVDRHRQATPLAHLTNEQLVARAIRRFGGPTPEELTEASRRITALCERISPAFRALRSAGVIPAA